MNTILKQAKITLPIADGSTETLSPRSFTVVKGSLLLKDQYEKAKHVKLGDFPDKTGFESFVNHVHIPYDGSRESIESCLKLAAALQKALRQFGKGRPFLVILSVSNKGCVVRFHQSRQNEEWLAKDLDGYREEGILVLPVEGTEREGGKPGRGKTRTEGTFPG
jgi:hypothetical protein